ncbi:MAG: branched-chain amino acid ABC transporter permease [Desulfobacterota bacterium]|nr:branched-chain amino acid ABC transporter permease [Thermodesulfobacteriota bacterium]MDW8002442.1 branched-chain amino acid ABC transporter permease [Deltaproteobacteria bacterium]
MNVKKLVAISFIVLLLLPLFLPRFYVYLTSLILIHGLLATSLNLVLGYGGIFQFHHCVFYGVGAYATALILKKTSLSAFFAFVAGPIAATLLSLGMGLICVRLSKLYFGMLQISLGSLVWAVVYRWYSFTGGDDGIQGIPVPEILSSTNGAFYFTLIITALSMAVMYMIVVSPFGKALQGIRDNPTRCEMVGVNIKAHQLTALTIAGFFAGVAGMLFVVVNTNVFPEIMFWTLSLEAVIMCLIGGWFSFLGPMLGAALVLFLRTIVSAYTDYWALVLGVTMALVIFFLPNGILGFIEERLKGVKNHA